MKLSKKILSIIINCLVFITIAIILFLVSYTKKTSYRDKFFLNNLNENELSLYDEKGQKAVYLKFDSDYSIDTIDIIDEKGFSLTVECFDGGIKILRLTDMRISYQNLMQFDINNDILLERFEQFGEFSRNYQLLSTGHINLNKWDNEHEKWITEIEP
jgi:hypothetical protein